MADLPALSSSSSWWLRAVSSVTTFTRATLAQMGVGTRAPASPGAAYGTIAHRPLAEQHLQQFALSPTVYAAALRRGRSLGNYPFVVLRDEDVVDPRREPWAGELLALLESPDPEDAGGSRDPMWLAPIEPGEGLIAQLVVDLLLEGWATCIPTAGRGGRLAGLTRAHPKTMSLVRGGEAWARKVDGRVELYDRRAVFCLRNPSWEATGQGELGTGAGAVLEPLVAAERQAMIKSAMVIEQGGADVVVSATTPAAVQFLSNPANREKVKHDLQSALSMRDGGRVIVLGGDLDAKSIGLTPADIQAPQLLVAARSAELMALGVTPVAIGGDATNYATAALQYRVQAELDEALAAVFEAYLLRPLAQHYHRVAGRGVGRITCRMDLSSHPGYAYARTEAIDRMLKLVELGWSAEQAADIEQLNLPKPKGTPRAAVPAPQAPAKPSADKDEGKALGDGGEPRNGPVLRLASARAPAAPEGDIPGGVGADRPAARRP